MFLVPVTEMLESGRSRSIHGQVFYKMDILKNFTKYTRKHLRRSSIISKVVGVEHNRQQFRRVTLNSLLRIIVKTV